MNDIDLAGIEWIPIGISADSPNKFKGIFDGNGKTIRNLEIDTTNPAKYQATGLFGALNGTVKNFTLDGVTIAGMSGGDPTSNGIAALAGSIYPTGLIEGVTVKNANISGNRYVAGIAGYVYGSIKDCAVENVTLTATPNSISEGKFDNGDKVGGIAGYFPKDSTNVVSGNRVTNLTIKGYRDLGGVVGAAAADNAVINNLVDGVSITIDQKTNTYGVKDANADAIVGRVLSGTVSDTNRYTEVNIFNLIANADNLMKLQ